MKELISELKSHEIYLSVERDELVVDFVGDALPPELISKIKKNKGLLVEYLGKYGNNLNYTEIQKAAQDICYPVSSAQRRLWVLSQFKEGSVAYNISNRLDLKDNLNIDCFKKAIESTINRHEILRTVFKEDESGEIKQWIVNTEDLGFYINFKDFRKDQNKQQLIDAYIDENSGKEYDLEKGPLLRAALLQTGDEQYVFYFNMHHIISDGWSMAILTRDVLSYYEAYKANKKPELKELKIQYKDYSTWTLSQEEKESFKKHKDFWLNNLNGKLPLLDLPGSKQRPRIKSYNGRALGATIDAVLNTKLKKYAQDQGGSLFMVLLAGWNVLMHRYTSQTDIVTGTPVAGRDHADLEDQIGFYVNTLALRTEVNAQENFNEVFSRVKQNTIEAYDHQIYPFDRLLEELNVSRDSSRNAVFDVILTFQNNGEKTGAIDLLTIGLDKKDLDRITDLGVCVSKFDVDITFQEIGECLTLRIVYNTDVYEKEMVEALVVHYRQLLTKITEDPQGSIGQIDFLSEAEKNKLLIAFNNTEIVYPKEKTIIDLLEEQFEKTPDAPALMFEDKMYSYKALHELSNQLAHYLQTHYKIKADDLVGIKQERSEWMIVSILAVLKSGGAYVPIDPEYPQERIEYIEKDTECKVCLDEKELDKFRKDQANYSKEKIACTAKPNNLAYVIYTSGSTGVPKGVLIEHNGIVNRLLWMRRDLKINSTDVLIQKTPATFDVSVWELLLAFISGASLVVCKQGEHKNPAYLEQLIERKKVTVIHFVPSMLSAMVEDINWNKLTSLRHIICSGEALSKKLENLISKLAPHVKLHNYYGPTEASVDVTAINLSQFPTAGEEVSIGKPVDNTSIYIVNEMAVMQPLGVPGEILLGGVQLARGYLNKEALTHEKFIASPFKKGERLYKTGDLGKWLPNGTVEYSGRKDNQVKVRGYRIELGEIEQALLQNEQITEAVVLVKESQSNEKELVAYITSKTEQNTTELRTFLKMLLPEYMLPAYYIQLAALPLNSNGKIDRKALPDPNGLGLASGTEYLAPANEIEEKLVAMWEEVLQRKNIGVKDDFFALGGHSLKAMRLITAIKKEFGFKIDISDLFKNPTIENTASAVNFNLKQQQMKLNSENLREIEL